MRDVEGVPAHCGAGDFGHTPALLVGCEWVDGWRKMGEADLEIQMARWPEVVYFFGDRLTQGGSGATGGVDAAQVVVFDCGVFCEGDGYGWGQEQGCDFEILDVFEHFDEVELGHDVTGYPYLWADRYEECLT